MNIHEYQAKQLFARYEIPVPRGRNVPTADEAAAAAGELAAAHGWPVVVKAQIHAGGRGKAGGVKLARSPEEVTTIARGLLGRPLVTHQTGPQGRVVRALLVEQGLSIAKEYYLSLLVDRSTGRPVVVASREGGMEIEEVAARHPEKIYKYSIDPAVGLQAYLARMLGFRLGFSAEQIGPFQRLLAGLYRLLAEEGASQVEINPLITTAAGELLALDAKVGFDDNAVPLRPQIQALRDLNEESPLEVEASKYNLNYVKLDGTIGCMVNGAGLAMATMDVIKLAGGEPANFLDVGGGASKETVKEAFRILLSDPNVKGVFVNIFGGIVRCERIGGGIVAAAKEIEVKVPLVVRLEGTNAKEGRELLAKSDLTLEVASTMWEGAQKIVKLAKAR
ncbi:MAG: ADP-forming succinate--CoA ligase subunit beta [Nitrospirota bacterium]